MRTRIVALDHHHGVPSSTPRFRKSRPAPFFERRLSAGQDLAERCDWKHPKLLGRRAVLGGSRQLERHADPRRVK